MTRAEKIEREYGAVIRAAADEFRDHEDICVDFVRRWLSQFRDGDLKLAAKILREVNYFNGARLRQLTEDLVDAILASLPGVPAGEIAFVPVGGPGSGATTIARALGETARARLGQRPRLISLAEMEKADGLSAIALFDDFAGSGDTLKGWWETIEPLILPKRARSVLGVLVLNGVARRVIEPLAGNVLSAHELAQDANVLHSASNSFDLPEKKRLRQYCRDTRCGSKFVDGYGGCGLLVAFKHGCPNNSLPILWHRSRRWAELFKRRAI